MNEPSVRSLRKSFGKNYVSFEEALLATQLASREQDVHGPLIGFDRARVGEDEAEEDSNQATFNEVEADEDSEPSQV